MADIQIEASAYFPTPSISQRGGPFWTSPTVGYVIYVNSSIDLKYRKTADGGATWGGAVNIKTGTIYSYDCWADWQTAGDAGTKIHIAYIDLDSDDVRYVYLDTSGDSVGGDDLIEACQGSGSILDNNTRTRIHISITKARGGNLAVAFRYTDHLYATFYEFYTSPDGDTWTNEASPWEGDTYDYILLFPGNEADNQDVWATFWDDSANAVDLKTYDDSGNSWSKQLISAGMVRHAIFLQMDGQIRLSDGHLIFAAWSEYNVATADLRVWDINGAASITAKTNVITDEAETALVSVFVNQANDDIYITYASGTDFTTLVKVFYQKSDDGAGSWGGETALQADAEDDEKWISAGAMKADWGGKFQPFWYNDDLRDLFTNVDNGISIAPPVVAPTVTTQAASDIGTTTATGNGNITDTGGENCSKRGVAWDTVSRGDPGALSPADSDYANYEEETDSFGTGAFTRALTGLPSGTTIYARAYAYNSAGYNWGGEVSFKTVFAQAVGGGAVGMAGSLGIKVFRGVGDGNVGMAGSLGRKVSINVGDGAVGMAGTLVAIKRFLQNVGDGAVGMAASLGLKINIGVGDGNVGMTGTLGRFIKIAVGTGSVGMTGLLNTLTKIPVGGGAVGMASTLGLKIKLAVGNGAVGMIGRVTSLFILYYTVVKIDGVQIRFVKGSLKIDKRIEERSVVEFTVWDKTATSHYVKGQPIQIYDTGNHLTFAGFIHSSEERRIGASSLFHYVRCADNHYLADKRLAAESYVEETAAGDIVLDLWVKYLDGEGVTIGEIQDGPMIGQTSINWQRVSEAMDALAELANFIWYIDETKKLYFISRATNVAWWTATSSLINNARLTHANPLYRNRQFGRGGMSETSEQVEDRIGDGVGDPIVGTVAFAMGYKLAREPTITVAGRGDQDVGIKGLEAGKDWYWEKGSEVVTAAIAPAADAAIQVTYIGEWRVFTLTEDEDAIADRKSIEGGGSGYVDDIFRDASLITVAASLEKAAAKLARYGVTGRKLIFDTYQRGLEPGQLQTVNYPLLNLNNAELLIESVKIRVSLKTMIYYVTALEGPEVGSWSKLFQQLAERDKTIDRLIIGGDIPIIILVSKSEEWGWNEDVTVNVWACSVPAEDLYPAEDFYPC